MLYVKADDESILSYGEEVQRRQTVFMPLDLGIGINLAKKTKAEREFIKEEKRREVEAIHIVRNSLRASLILSGFKRML